MENRWVVVGLRGGWSPREVGGTPTRTAWGSFVTRMLCIMTTQFSVLWLWYRILALHCCYHSGPWVSVSYASQVWSPISGFIFIFVLLWVCTDECRCLQWPEEDIVSPGAGAMDGREPSDVGAGEVEIRLSAFNLGAISPAFCCIFINIDCAN